MVICGYIGLSCSFVSQICRKFYDTKINIMGNIAYYLDIRRAKKDGTYPVKLYVSHHGKFYVRTSFTAKEEEWDSNQYSKKAPNHKSRNMALRSTINKADEVMYRLEMDGRLVGTSDTTLKAMIEEAISGKPRNGRTLLTCFDEFIATKGRKNTVKIYSGSRDKVVLFGKDLPLDDIDKRWLMDFDGYMDREGLSVNSRSIHLRNTRAVFNYAIDEGYTTNYPFRKFQIKSEETRKRSLTVDELIRLRDYPCDKSESKYRDLFMLMFYLIGINGVDLFGDCVIEKGRLEYRRAKTGKLYSIRLEPEAVEIINRYAGDGKVVAVPEENGDYGYFVQRMSRVLKRIGKEKGGDSLFPGLSSYWARHTWATIAASLDIPKETISAALGHEIGSPITSIYIRLDQKKVDEANRMVIDYVNGYRKNRDER